MTWAIPRACVRCGEPGPRIVWIGGYVHHKCLTSAEKRERANHQKEGARSHERIENQ